MKRPSPSEKNLSSDNPRLSLPPATTICPLSLQLIALPEGLSGAVSNLIAAAIADSTRKAYRQDLEDFRRWGGSVPSSPEALAAYIADRSERLSPHTITRRVVGISRAHVSQGLPDPAKSDLVRTMLRGVRRKNSRPQRQVAPLLRQDLFSILSFMSSTKGIRDRAMILLGFAAALRRAELVALNVEDIQFVKEGVVVTLRRSKTDQEGVGRKIAVPYGRTHACPVRAIEVWLGHAAIESGPVFRSVGKGGRIHAARLTPQSVALVVKGYARLAGLNASVISGHSLRSGLVTSAAQAGVPTHKIQQQSGHRSLEMLARYIRDATIFENNAAGLLL